MATGGFKTKLGEGGSGEVYEGLLPGGTKVAVKRLQNANQGDKEFRTEVATIGNIHHINLVRLKGFCLGGIHRLLVYEYMVCSNSPSRSRNHVCSSSLHSQMTRFWNYLSKELLALNQMATW